LEPVIVMLVPPTVLPEFGLIAVTRGAVDEGPVDPPPPQPAAARATSSAAALRQE
jgi:hypothetical protein